MAVELDKAQDDISKLEKRVMGTIFTNGEREEKCLKKTTGWAATPPAVMVQEFKEHFNTLPNTADPAIELIKLIMLNIK